jgi:hypothetical protein
MNRCHCSAGHVTALATWGSGPYSLSLSLSLSLSFRNLQNPLTYLIASCCMSTCFHHHHHNHHCSQQHAHRCLSCSLSRFPIPALSPCAVTHGFPGSSPGHVKWDLWSTERQLSRFPLPIILPIVTHSSSSPIWGCHMVVTYRVDSVSPVTVYIYIYIYIYMTASVV